MNVKKLAALGMAIAMTVSAVLTGCGNNDSVPDSNIAETGAEENAGKELAAYGIEETVKIGVLVSDASTDEAQGFRSYYENYLGQQYKAEFIYSEELTDAEGEISAIEQFITQGCQGIISLSSFDRPGQIDACEDAGIYYGVAAGTLSDEEYESFKGYEYYVGSIGPSLETEYLTGYDMAKYFLDEGDDNFLIFSGAAAYGTEMHIYRVAGMLCAMCDADSSTSYGGATDKDGIIQAVYSDLGVKKESFVSEKYTIDAVNGYNMDDAWWGEISEKLFVEGLDTVLAVGNGSDFFGSQAKGAVKVGSVDTYADGYYEAMNNNQLNYMAGKFAAGIAPIFVAVVDAVNGNPLRTSDGSAFSIDQGYWVATDAETFQKYVDGGSVESPVYTKEILDQYIATNDNAVTYSDFETFVSAYTFDEIMELK